MGRVSLAIVAILIIIGSIVAVAASGGTKNQTVYDVSWPNCQVAPPKSARWAIVGVTGGLDFRPNPCLAQEANAAGHLSLYANTGYPGISYGKRLGVLPRSCEPTDKICWAYNYGFSATIYAIKYANAQAVHATVWWLDVETENSWTNDISQNRASLEGAIAAIGQNVFLAKVGIYSSPAQWQIITGSWKLNLPNWVATGSISPAVAQDACKSTSFSGGPIWLTQYTPSLDADYTCTSNFFNAVAGGQARNQALIY